ncbi:MAG TPA: hypothetical protein DGR97_05320 [Gammaproteobacteria bacterium]|nr:hypothetical protein [Gammaproteobacteria bacterium]
MQQLISYLRAIPLAVILMASMACNTLSQKPHQPHQPPQTKLPTQATDTQNQQQRSTQPGAQPQSSQLSQPELNPEEAPEQMQSEMPAQSEDSADVEITDIPVDENGNPIIAPRPSSSTTEKHNSSSQPTNLSGTASSRKSDGRSLDSRGSPLAGAESGLDINIGAMTEAERVTALQQDLQGRLAKFDELMRRAREDAKRDRMTTGGDGAEDSSGSVTGSPDGQGARQAPPQNGRGAGGQSDTSSGRGHTPDLTGDSGEGAFKYAGDSTPIDTQTGRDDDIVARQLREAATGESDPVLRGKLWEEYRRYKRGIGD